MRLALLTVYLASTVLAKSVDVGKGTDVIPPDSKEAAALHDSDKAVKTSPKDNTVREDLIEGGDKYTKTEPKLDHQVVDANAESQEKVVKDDDHPVVLNDYDPNNIGVSEKDSEKEAKTKTKSKEKDALETPQVEKPHTPPPQSQGASGFHSFTMAASMILFSEVGDKTFLIAALMAMKHPRLTVFTSALSSLIVMSILSAFLGHTLPALMPKKVTSLLAAALFVVFGVKLLREGLEMSPGVGVEEEMEEVEHEIEEQEFAHREDDLERGLGSNSNAQAEKRSSDGEVPLYTSRRKGATTAWGQFVEGFNNLASLVLSPIWVQVFVMTFLGEWGDRSQVATIAMAAGSDYWFVIVGAIAGHAVCTGAAVIGGKLLATKISMRHVTLAGAVAFMVFAVIYFYEGISLSWSG